MNEMIKTIKEVHNKDICMFKIGAFYHVYGRDSIIISYIFNYKIKEYKNTKDCGFPENVLNKIIAKLESLKINYMVIDNRNEYNVDLEEDYKDKNEYDKLYENANKYVICKKRIDNITEFLNENIDQKFIIKLLGKMEEIIYERGEI